MNKFSKPKMSALISRAFEEFGFKKESENKAVLTGIPIVFNQKTDIGGFFEEIIDHDAISEDVLRDVALFFNHDLNAKPHARTRNGSLRFEIKNDGVHMEADINVDRSDSKDLYLAIKDKNIDGMSFMFRIEEEEWQKLDTDYPLRIIKKIGYVQEVSAVNYPAYPGTSIDARTDLLLDNDKKALDNARAKALDSVENLELEKLKAKVLHHF